MNKTGKLALAFYNNKVAAIVGDIILKDALKKSLGIRMPLLRNINVSEEILGKTQA